MELTLSHFVAIVTILVSVYPGNTEHICDFDRSCLHIYNNMKGIFEDQGSDMATLCSLSHDLKDCMKKTSRRCRGDLNYHFFEKLFRDLNANIGVGKNCAGGVPKGSEETNGSSISSSGGGSNHHEISHHNHHGRGKGGRARDRQQAIDRCTPKIPADSSVVGCALFGLTNLKSFSEGLNYTDINYCSLAGAWSLIDTPEFAVQITNKGGLSPLPKDITATTLVTVIIKSNQCSERKTYQATFDEVPGMFSDGYTTAGSVFIETITESEHVKIHFPYFLTTIDIIKVLDKIPIPSLTVAIKMPESIAQSFITEPTKLRGLPLCFYGCPRTATMKPRAESSSVSARSASSDATPNYYRSRCPDPELDYDELPQADSSVLPPQQVHHSQKVEEAPPTHFSAEFLTQDSSFDNTDFGGQRSQRSSSGSTAVICASLNSVHDILLDTNVVKEKLKFPGEGEGGHQADSSFESVMNSALTSQSANISRFPFIFLYLTVVLIFTWS